MNLYLNFLYFLLLIMIYSNHKFATNYPPTIMIDNLCNLLNSNLKLSLLPLWKKHKISQIYTQIISVYYYKDV